MVYLQMGVRMLSSSWLGRLACRLGVVWVLIIPPLKRDPLFTLAREPSIMGGIVEAVAGFIAVAYALGTIGCLVVGLVGGRAKPREILVGGDRDIYK